MIHQNFKLVRRFTVAENVLLSNPRGAFVGARKAIEAEIREKEATLGFGLPGIGFILGTYSDLRRQTAKLRCPVVGVCM
jgi:ABC-type sugar transport system ATPase subunit